MRRAFVTGGSGFIGGALVRRLVAEGWTARALARSDPSARAVQENGAETVRGDLSGPNATAAGAQGSELAFHAAAHLGDRGRREDFLAGNVHGTRNVIAACAGPACGGSSTSAPRPTSWPRPATTWRPS